MSRLMPSIFFGKLPVDPTYRYQTVVLEHPTSITRIKTVFAIDEAQLRPLNRALTRFVWRGWRLVPAGYRLHLPHKKDRWQAERVKLASLRPEKVIGGGDRYTVRRGDTACGIARAVKVNCSELIRANHLGKTALIIAGQKLVIPRKLMVVDSSGGTRKSLGQSGATTYRVRKGDTACAIAKRFGVDCRTLINHNRLGRTAKIYPGQTLSISGQVPASIQPGGLNADHLYIVRKGDSACRVAQRFAVNCAALQQLNQLNRTTIIHPGQKLKIPGLVVPQTSATAQLLAGLDELKPTATAEPYESDEARSDLSTAQTVDAWLVNLLTDLSTAQADEARSDQSTAQTVDAWLVNVRTDLSTAQTVDASDAWLANVRTDLSTAQTDEARFDLSTAQTVDAWLVNLRTDGNDDASSDGNTDILRNLLDTLPDLGIHVSVDADASDEKPIYSVRVEADETLGHFADWLGIVGTARLRAMNHLRSGRSIAIDQRLILPVTDAQMVERFEQRRTDYHQVLSESLKEHYDLVGIANHTVQRGDSAWSLSEQLGFPVWLLYRLNPILRDAPLVPGQVVVLPKLKAKV